MVLQIIDAIRTKVLPESNVGFEEFENTGNGIDGGNVVLQGQGGADWSLFIKMILMGLFIRLLTVYLASLLWARVMPKISSAFKTNPGVLNLFILSIMFKLLF